MGEKLIESLTTIAVAIIGIAIIAVLVSKQADTAGVVGAAAKGFATDISAAISPVTGGGGLLGGLGNFPTLAQ